jgi:hypothetical protein
MEGPSQGRRSRQELRRAAAARGRGKPHPQRTAACNVRSWPRRGGPRRLQRPACAARNWQYRRRGARESRGEWRCRPRLAAACRVRGWQRWRRAAASGARSKRRAAPAAGGIGGAGPGEQRQAAPMVAWATSGGGAGHGRPRRAAPGARGCGEPRLQRTAQRVGPQREAAALRGQWGVKLFLFFSAFGLCFCHSPG